MYYPHSLEQPKGVPTRKLSNKCLLKGAAANRISATEIKFFLISLSVSYPSMLSSKRLDSYEKTSNFISQDTRITGLPLPRLVSLLVLLCDFEIIIHCNMSNSESLPYISCPSWLLQKTQPKNPTQPDQQGTDLSIRKFHIALNISRCSFPKMSHNSLQLKACECAGRLPEPGREKDRKYFHLFWKHIN